MKDLTLSTLIAVFEEIFGRSLFWAMVILAIAILGAFVYAVWRDRGLDSRNFLRAELSAPVGAIAAILFVQWFTSSGFADVGGPVDVLVLVLIGLGGAIGLVFLTYLAMALWRGRQAPATMSAATGLVATTGDSQG
jgi:hypothetical protein